MKNLKEKLLNDKKLNFMNTLKSKLLNRKKGFTPTPNDSMQGSSKNISFSNDSNGNTKNHSLVWGFTLLEILLVLGIMSITMFAVGTTWLGFRGKAELDSTTRNIVDVLRSAQNNSITNEGFATWGVHFESSSNPFFEIFTGTDWATGTRKEHFILPKGITFYTPPKGAISGETVELQITSNSDITVTDGSNVTSGAPAVMSGTTTFN